MGRRGPAPDPRLPWPAVLTVYIRTLEGQGNAEPSQQRRGMSEFARQLGMLPSQIYRWKRDGFTLDGAERVSMHLGLHPAEVWGVDLYVDAVERKLGVAA